MLGLVGFWAVIQLLLWPGLVTLGILTVSVLYGAIGFLCFISGNIALVYFRNEARKHWREGAFDDRLTDTRMAQAQEDLIRGWKQRLVED